MSILRVHDGFFGLTLQQALDKASPGATIALTPGTYAQFESIPVGDLRIIGAGSRPEDVVLVTQLDVHDQAIVENLTLQAPHFHNAARLRTPRSVAVFKDTIVLPEPTGRFPAVYAEGGDLTVRRSTVEARSGGLALHVEAHGDVTVEESTLGLISAVGSTVTTTNSTHGAFHLSAASKVHARGAFTLMPESGMRGLVLSGYSVLTAEQLATADGCLEMSLEDSALEVAEVSAPDDADVHVMASGASHVQAPSDTVRVTDLDRQKAEQEAAERRRREEGGRGTIADLHVEQPCEVFVAGSLQIAHVSPEPHVITLVTTDTGLHQIPGDALAPVDEEPSQTATADATLDGHPAGEDTGDTAPSADPAPGGGEDEAAAASPDGDPMAQLRSLTGLADVKNQVQTFMAEVRFAEARRQRGFAVRRQTLHSQFLGNPGTGKTTVARLLGRALHQVGVLHSDVFVEVTREDLVSEHIGGTGPKTRKILESALGGILFIDEAYTLAEGGPQDFGREAIATLLAFMENHRDEFMVILAGYPEQMHAFFKSNPGLRSRVPLRFDFEDYTTSELVQMGLTALEEDGFTVDADAYRRTLTEAHRSSGDRSNGRWVRNLNDRLVRHMAHRVMTESVVPEEAAADDDDRLSRITSADLHALLGQSPGDDTGVADLLAELDAMVGLDSVKAWVRSLVAQAEADNRLREAEVDLPRPTYHMVFAGSPGTGKTTVARFVGKLFHRLGILSTPQVVEANRERMVGRYIGHTEERTGLLLDEARGGVLFVDEAYQLDVPDSANDFGKAAVETLVTRLENDRDSFVAIFAGYTDRMAQFMQLNPGLASRVPHSIEFPDYSPDDIAEIVTRTLGRTWTFDESVLRSAVSERYASLPPAIRSNARQAGNYADAISQAHKAWITESSTNGDSIRHIRDEVITGALAGKESGGDG